MRDSLSIDEMYGAGGAIEISPPPSAVEAPISDTQPVSAFYQTGRKRKGVLETIARTEKPLLVAGIEKLGAAARGDATRKYPELGSVADVAPTEAAEMKIAAGFFAEPTEEGRIGIIKQHIPTAQFGRDENNNLFTVIEGKPYYINKPGLSVQDFVDVASEITKYLPGYRAAQKMTRAAGPVTRATAQGTMAGVTEIASDIAAQALGSKKAVDLGQAGQVAGVVAGIEAISPPIIRFLGKLAKGRKLTTKEVQQLTEAGIDPNQLSPDAVKQIIAQRGVGTPAQQAAIAEAGALPQPVQLTRAQITKDPSDFLKQTELLKTPGAAGDITRAALTRQQEALRGTATEIQERLAGGIARFETPAQIGAAVQETLGDIAILAKEGVRQAYKIAKGKKATMPQNFIDDLSSGAQGIMEEFDPVIQPAAQRISEQLAKLPDKSLTTLEKWRKRAVHARKGTTDASEREALRQIIKHYDDSVNFALDDALISGDKDAIEAWKKAKSLRARYGRMFEQGDVIEKLTARSPSGDAVQLNVSPDDAADYIFGRAAIGAKKGLVKDLKKMKDILPARDFDALREGAFMRLMRNQDKETFSGVKFAKEVDSLFDEAPEAAKVLFSSKEIDMIQRFKRVGLLATKTPQGAVNYSNTAGALWSRLTNSFGITGDIVRGVANTFTGRISEAVRTGQAKRAVAGELPKKVDTLGLPVLAAAGTNE